MEISNGNDGTPTIRTSGWVSVNDSSRRTSCLAVPARSAWIRSTASASGFPANRSAAAHACSAVRSVSRGWVRLITTPASGISSSESRSAKNAASRRAGRSADETTRNSVPLRRRIAWVREARVANPPNVESSATTISEASLSMDEPTTAETPRIAVLMAPVINRPTPRPGAANTRMRRLSMNAPSRRGASRKSRALREGGVSTTTRSHVESSSNWPSFSMAMYSCVPAKEVTMVL